MSTIPDFTDNELWLVETTLRERYGEPVEIQLADTELRLDPDAFELTPCPALYWERNGCHFVIFKVGDKHYRSQFYYRLHQQYGTGIKEFDDVTECTVVLLQTQADHEAKERGDLPGK